MMVKLTTTTTTTTTLFPPKSAEEPTTHQSFEWLTLGWAQTTKTTPQKRERGKAQAVDSLSSLVVYSGERLLTN